MWAKAATTTEDQDGEALIPDLTEEDIQEAIDAAKAVGDDRIQEATGGSTPSSGRTARRRRG